MIFLGKPTSSKIVIPEEKFNAFKAGFRQGALQPTRQHQMEGSMENKAVNRINRYKAPQKPCKADQSKCGNRINRTPMSREEVATALGMTNKQANKIFFD